MRKILVIARREFVAMVGAKAFLISVALMPVLMMGGALIPQLIGDHIDVRTKRIAVLDHSGTVFAALDQAVGLRNQQEVKDPATGKLLAPPYELEQVATSPVTDELRLALSDRVRKGELAAFVEIPAGILLPPRDDTPAIVPFYAENTALSAEKRWFDRAISQIVQQARLTSSGIDPQVVHRSELLSVQGRSLVQRDAAGNAKMVEGRSELLAIFLPMGIMMFMFMVIMMSSQPMLQTVLEEKTNRIAEVLLGSATPTQIMVGKLVGNVAGSLLVTVIYLVGAFALASYNDMLDVVPFAVLPWLLLFLALAVIMFSSLFMAIGASVNELKEAQNLLLPVWLLVCLPMFIWLVIVKEPMSSFSTWFSLTPPFIPMLMALRLAATDAVPWWQPVVGLILMLATTSLAVFAAGRIFRIGMLSQGQAPKLGDLLRWAVRG